MNGCCGRKANGAVVLDVYFASIPKEADIDLSLISSEKRRAYIDSAKNGKVRLERYWVWRLFDYAIYHSFGKRLAECEVWLDSFGAWRVSGCELSLSHAAGVVAVAISNLPVGVDVEAVGRTRGDDFARKVLTRDEYEAYSAIDDSEKERELVRLWSMKESLFKASGSRTFSPDKTDTRRGACARWVWLSDAEYVISVASESLEAAKLICVEHFK